MSAVNVNKSNFKAEVLQSEKKVLLDFWAPWCGPCRMVAPVLEEIAREREDVKVCKLNVDQAPELAAQFGITGIPTIMLIKDGRILQKQVGVSSKQTLLNML